jgi:hypothetical protein
MERAGLWISALLTAAVGVNALLAYQLFLAH